MLALITSFRNLRAAQGTNFNHNISIQALISNDRGLFSCAKALRTHSYTHHIILLLVYIYSDGLSVYNIHMQRVHPSTPAIKHVILAIGVF